MDGPSTDLLYHQITAPAPETALAALTPPVRQWFERRYGAPTRAQCLAWPALAAQEPLFLCAPTGTGKTLAAFLPIIGALFEHRQDRQLGCVYVTPLKALARDMVGTLRTCMKEIRAEAHDSLPRLRVGLRTGDTQGKQRQRLWTDPPAILVTTPESLALLLSYPAAARLFANVRWLVIDEVHALAGNKRGADLTLTLERLTALMVCPPPRIGLSATCQPLSEAAAFVTGANRACTVAQVAEANRFDLAIEPLPEIGGSFVQRLLDRLEGEIHDDRTLLVFTNTRSLAERLIWALRRAHPEWEEQTAVHHSALAAGRRRLVERRLKQGELRIVISSTSLELGIDIGCIDTVVLVHPPGAVIRLLQRLGRSGHEPHRARRGLVLTNSPAELLEAAVTAASSRSGQWEPLRVLDAPLDVLCQQLLGMAAQRSSATTSGWTADAAYALVRQAYPYRGLTRAHFDGCLAYLSGQDFAGNAWLPSRLAWQNGGFTIVNERAVRVLRRNIGTILTEQPCAVRLCGQSNEDANPTSIGEVEERFADRLSPGDRFLLDGRCLELRRSEAGALLVDEVVGQPAVPRWTSEGLPLSRELARRLSYFRTQAAEALREGPTALARLLRHEYRLGRMAAQILVRHFQLQECVSEIPEEPTLLVEAVEDDAGGAYYLHTPLHRAGNDALARVLVWRLARACGVNVSSIVADLGLALYVAGPVRLTPDRLRRCLEAEAFDEDLSAALADSFTLREQFRRSAHIGLMLLRHPLTPRRRVGGRDWPERRLFDQVRAHDPSFVLLRQAERDLRAGLCDADAARQYLEQLPSRPLHWRDLDQPSPFAESWTQMLAGPVGGAETPADALERLHATLTVGAHDEPATR
ncbi:MAG TPA: DEAD/DEAH box helicase [Gemmataceae bacterium]|nr:DEAD/DEAH box helicase [Gemmataceae bacterium]